MTQQQPEELAPAITLDGLGWTHAGLIIGPGEVASFEAAVADPCISFDEKLMRWRLFYTGRAKDGREVCAQVLSKRPDLIGPGEWVKEEGGPLTFTNPAILAQRNYSQPSPIFEPLRSNYEPALIDGKYWLLFTLGGPEDWQAIYAASSPVLSEPWTILPLPIIQRASIKEHRTSVNSAAANWFPARQVCLIYYSSGRHINLAQWQPGEPEAQNLGVILEAAKAAPAWCGHGPLQGLQLLPGREHRWYGLLNAGRPGVAGFAYTDEEWPVSGWHFLDEPIEHIDAIPAEAQAWGEGEHLGRHSMLVLPGGGLRLFYESGPPGNEQIYLKRARQ